MTKSIQDILNEFSDSITKKGYAIEGLDLSYVDTKENHLEIFTYSTQKYEEAVRAGFDDKEIGSLLLSKETFNGTSTIIYENRFLNIPKSNQANDDKETPYFKEFSNTFSGNSKATHQKWINHYKKHQINGVYFFVGRRRKDDFDLVLFGVVNGNDKKEIKKNIRPIINTFLNKLNDFAIVFEKLRQHRNDIETAAVRAAISQVMARNSSHNIGSHVMNKLTGNLSSLALLDFSEKDELNYQSTYQKDLQKLHSEIETEINNDTDLESLTNGHREKVLKHKILLAQIALFNNYIKCRMDYLSDITLGIPSMQISKRLKSDVLSALDGVRLLLENISGLSKFKYSLNIVCDFDGDPAIAMPNDILGCQAFYNIIENIIRNTAKHSDKKNIDDSVNAIGEKGIVHFTICIKKISDTNSNNVLHSQSDLLYEVNIYDNIKLEGAAELNDEDKAEYNAEINTSNGTSISKLDYLVFSQNKKLNDSILKKDDNTLRSTSLGLIEMEASACYLRKMDIYNLESDDYEIDYNDKIENSKGNLNILKAVAIKNKYLGYRFFVLKPTEVLLVGNYELSAELKNNGFLCLSFEEFQSKIEKETAFNHQFLVSDSEIQLKIDDSDFSKYKCSKGHDSFTYFKSLTPKRYFQLAGDSLEFNKKSAEEILNCLWTKWGEIEINKKWSEKKITNSLLGDTPKDDIIFLNHSYSELRDECERTKFNEYFNNDETYDYYIEPLSSKAQSKLPKAINELKNSSIKDRNSVKESAFQQMVIIDERVQYAAYHNKDEGILFHKYYQKSNILVPNKDIDLAANDLDSIKEKLNTYLAEEIDKNSIGKERFLLIHYSILERLFKASTNKISEVNNWLNEYAKKTNVVVVSGRGIPPELPDSVSYVSLSSVLASLIDFRSKYYFSNIIMSSRKSKKNE